MRPRPLRLIQIWVDSISARFLNNQPQGAYMSTKLILFALPILLVLSMSGRFTHAETVDLGTDGNSSQWLVTAAGAVDAASFQTNVNRTGAIAITSDALESGSFLSGGSLAQFNGFWRAEIDFFLPATANDASLTFDGFYANDRGLLLLNGIEIGNVDHLGATGDGLFQFTEAGVDQAYTFTGLDSGSVNTGFLLGQSNTLSILVNNTGEIPITAPTRTFDGSNDATTAFINASVSFTAVPEPGASMLCVLGLGATVLRRQRG
jgi:hypothetical protein